MKTISTIFAVLLLTACSIFPSAFDGQEHARIVSIHVAAKDNTVCDSPDRARPTVNQMYRDTEWLYHYGSNVENNEDLTRMELYLLGMVREARDRYNREERVSVLYCKSKFDNIHRTTEKMMQVSGRRSRS